MRFLTHFKKVFVLSVAALSIAIVNNKPASALTMAENYLQQIAQNTQSILSFLQNPSNFAGLAASWMQLDTGDESITTKSQQILATLGWQYTTSDALVKALQKQLVADIVNKPLADFSGKAPKILLDLPEINDISYTSLLGIPPSDKAPVELYNYIKHASAANTARPLPSSAWQGQEDAKQKYRDYYDTVSAVESYDGYVLSELAVQTTMKTNETRDQLVTMASSSSWIAQIATQELGRVFRQILLFVSQTYVLNTQIEKELRQLVSLQAMNNSLIIKSNLITETQLIMDAKGKTGAVNTY